LKQRRKRQSCNSTSCPGSELGSVDGLCAQSCGGDSLGTNFAQRTKAGAFFSAVFIDPSCPPTGVYASYNQISGPKNILDQYLLGHHPSAEADDGSREAVLRHVEAVSAVKP
jgi:hypothetical protein